MRALSNLLHLCFAQVASQAHPVAKEVTDGVVRPGGKAVAAAAGEIASDETHAKVLPSRTPSLHFAQWCLHDYARHVSCSAQAAMRHQLLCGADDSDAKMPSMCSCKPQTAMS
jgi:hypothetical protein